MSTFVFIHHAQMTPAESAPPTAGQMESLSIPGM